MFYFVKFDMDDDAKGEKFVYLLIVFLIYIFFLFVFWFLHFRLNINFIQYTYKYFLNL